MTKYIPTQDGVSGTFLVTGSIYLTEGEAFEESQSLLDALDAAEITYTDPPGTAPTGRVKVFSPDNNRILLDLSGVPSHIEANLFFTPTAAQLTAIQAGYGYQREYGPLDADICAINEQIFPSPYFADETGLVSSVGMNPLEGSWSTDGDGSTTWTPTKTMIEGIYEVTMILSSLGNEVYVDIGNTGTSIFTPPSLYQAVNTAQVVVRDPGTAIRVYEGAGDPGGADSLFIKRVS